MLVNIPPDILHANILIGERFPIDLQRLFLVIILCLGVALGRFGI